MTSFKSQPIIRSGLLTIHRYPLIITRSWIFMEPLKHMSPPTKSMIRDMDTANVSKIGMYFAAILAWRRFASR